MMHPKILIVGTVPYNKKMQSRAFDAYFHQWDPENIAQVFSNPMEPTKGHCGTLYQVTDSMMLHRWLHHNAKVGRIYKRESLSEQNDPGHNEQTGSMVGKLYQMGKRKSPLNHLLRKLLWRKKYWCTEEFLEWCDAFNPECIFLAFSDDFFIPEIALFLADRYDVPIVSCIGDDYYFNDKKSISPLYYIYRRKYKSLIDKVFAHGGSAMYISDKIRDKYNREFSLNGETVYLTSEIKRKTFRPIPKDHPTISYFGNISLGRNNSLNDIGKALGQIRPDYMLNVFSNETSRHLVGVFDGNKNVCYKGAVPYTEVMAETDKSDILIIVEGFADEDITAVKYSLSTKAADSLASGASIFVYGPLESGVIDYMNSTGASMVCCDKADLVQKLKTLIEDAALQKKLYDQAIVISEAHHTLKSSNAVSEKVITEAINNYHKHAKG